MIIRIATIAAILAIVLGAMQVGSVAFASGGAGGSCNNFRVDPNSSETVIENHSGTANYEFKNTGTKSFNVKVNGRKVLTVDPGETKGSPTPLVGGFRAFSRLSPRGVEGRAGMECGPWEAPPSDSSPLRVAALAEAPPSRLSSGTLAGRPHPCALLWDGDSASVGRHLAARVRSRPLSSH